eukprot:5200878-Pleurochrysis_carterae.AAC.4
MFEAYSEKGSACTCANVCVCSPPPFSACLSLLRQDAALALLRERVAIALDEHGRHVAGAARMQTCGAARSYTRSARIVRVNGCDTRAREMHVCVHACINYNAHEKGRISL